MTKEKGMKEVILTEREQDVIKWLARSAYENIRADFDEDGKQGFFDPYMTVAMMLYQHDEMNAMYFIGMLLEQGYNKDLAELMTKVCKPGDDSIDIFLKEFRKYVTYGMFDEDDEEDFDEDEPELYDVNFDPELDEDPFAVVSIKVDREKCPDFESKMKDILQTLGIKFPVFRKKEREEDE